PLAEIPAEERRRGVWWLEPRLVVEVDFRGWTSGGRVRQGSLQGLREDKSARQVVREVSQMLETTGRKQAALLQKAPTKTSAAKSRATKSSAAKPSVTKPHKAQPVAVAGVTLTHPDRVYWEDAGVTK